MWIARVLAGLALAPALAPAADADFDRLMSALAQHKHGEVSFVEEKYLALLDRPVESAGTLLYDAPDHLEKRTTRPKAESLVLDGNVLTAQRGRHKYVLNLQQYPQVVPFIESLRATLAGDRPKLEQLFKVDFGGSFEHWSLELVPLDTKLAGAVKRIRIEGQTDRIDTVGIFEADGDRSLLRIDSAAPQ